MGRTLGSSTAMGALLRSAFTSCEGNDDVQEDGSSAMELEAEQAERATMAGRSRGRSSTGRWAHGWGREEERAPWERTGDVRVHGCNGSREAPAVQNFSAAMGEAEAERRGWGRRIAGEER
jgi:hypothetical protein